MIRGTSKTARSRRAIALYLTGRMTLSDASRRMGLRARPRLTSPVRRHTRIRQALARLTTLDAPRTLMDVCRELGLASPSNLYTALRRLGLPRGPARGSEGRMTLAVRLVRTSIPPIPIPVAARYYRVSIIRLTQLVNREG